MGTDVNRFSYALTLVSPTGELMLTFPDRNCFSTAKTESGHAFCTDCTTEQTMNTGLSISDKTIEIETESAFSLLNSEAVNNNNNINEL